MNSFVLPFEACDHSMLRQVGGKCSSLGELTRNGFRVPPGFAVTTEAFVQHLAQNDLNAKIHALLEGLQTSDTDALDRISLEIRSLIETASMPQAIAQAIHDEYASLAARLNLTEPPVAVRSSATAEDLPGASFAGQQDTYLYVVGAQAVLEHTRRCWASLYTSRAIAYRHDNGFPHEKVLMAVGVQKMVNARAAGVAMTLNPINGDRSKIVIDSSFGLGETVVGGLVTPDNFVVDKVILEVVKRQVSRKHLEIVPDVPGRTTLERHIEPERQLEPSLTLEEIKAVASIAKRCEQQAGNPQDVEWALDADLPNGENIVLLQSRPETVWSQKPSSPTTSSAYQTGMGSILNTLMNPIAAKKSSD